MPRSEFFAARGVPECGGFAASRIEAVCPDREFYISCNVPSPWSPASSWGAVSNIFTDEAPIRKIHHAIGSAKKR